MAHVHRHLLDLKMMPLSAPRSGPQLELTNGGTESNMLPSGPSPPLQCDVSIDVPRNMWLRSGLSDASWTTSNLHCESCDFHGTVEEGSTGTMRSSLLWTKYEVQKHVNQAPALIFMTGLVCTHNFHLH